MDGDTRKVFVCPRCGKSTEVEVGSGTEIYPCADCGEYAIDRTLIGGSE